MSQEAVVNKRIQGTQNRSKLRTTIQIAMLGAVATVLMMFEFPLPFIAPPFVQMDFSEIPVVVGTFAMGPLAGIIIEICHSRYYHSRGGRIVKFPNRLLLCSAGRSVL